MDRRLRKLERDWQRSGDSNALNRFLHELLRFQSLDSWETAAEQEDSFAVRYLPLLRNLDRDSLSESVVFVNAYEDFTARSSISVSPQEITQVRRWLRDFYEIYPLFYSGEEVFDISLQQTIADPPAQFVIQNSSEPCFRFQPSEISERAAQQGIEEDHEDENLAVPSIVRRLSPINRWGQRDHYVSFQIIDSYPDSEELDIPEEDIESTTMLPHWINAYETGRFYGGPEEGGWWFNAFDPLAAIYVGYFPADVSEEFENSLFRINHTVEGGYTIISDLEIPQYLTDAVNFMGSFYEEVTHGDIYSVRGGSYLDLRIQTHPALREPFYHPYYQ